MNLEPSYESTEQELRGPAQSGEANHNPIVQVDNEGEQFPAIVTPGRDQKVEAHQALQEPIDFNDAAKTAFRQYKASGQGADLDQAVKRLQEALKLIPSDSSDRFVLLSNLSVGLRHRYTRTGDLADLEAAITASQQAVQAAPANSPHYPALLSNLGVALNYRYSRTGNQADLETTITAFQHAVQVTSLDSPDRPKYLNNLGSALRDRYARTGELADLEAAVQAYEQAVQATPLDSPDLPGRLSNLSIGLRDSYARTGEPADLEAAIRACEQAVQATPPDSPNRPTLLNSLGNGLHDRYTCSGELADLEAAIQAHEQAVRATTPNSPDLSGHLNNLGNVLSTHYIHTGELADLEAAIRAHEQAVRATPLDSPDYPMYLNNLGSGLHDRYARTGELADLEAAIWAFEQAVRATPPGSPYLPGHLNNLGIGLSARYIRTGELADLEAAIRAYEQVVRAVPLDSPDHPMYLNNLSNGLLDRYIHTGELADLEAAISAFQSIAQTASPNSPNLPGHLNNLGMGLSTRYMRTGELADLEAAIGAFEQAVQATPSDSPDLPRHLNNLGSGLYDRYMRTGELADLEAAIRAHEQAVRTTLAGSPDRPALLNNLGNELLARYTRTGELGDLEAAICAHEQAVQATLASSPDLPGHLNNLGMGLSARYKRTGELADLEAAIRAHEQAVQATLAGSPTWPTLLDNLGSGLRDWYHYTGKLADLEAAITAWERGWFSLHLQFAALPVAYQLGQQRQAAEVATSLIEAYLERAGRNFPHTLSTLRWALEVAEGNKSRLLTQLVGRGPLPLPEGLAPELAAQEQQLLSDLTALDVQELATRQYLAPVKEDNSRLARLQLRQAAQRELENLWAQITHIGPGGAEYVALRRGTALTWREFTDLAKELGPTAALFSFFTTADQALLFLLRAGWRVPRVFKEPLNQNSWADLLDRFSREVHYHDPGLPLNETWDHPLGRLLIRAQRHLEGVERLILAPAGNGHLLPWAVLAERAGWHAATGQPLPLVTLPALSILPRLRKRQPVPPGPVLVVGDPHGDLHHAEDEAREVAKRYGTEPLLGTAATKSEVLARLPDATLIHLATHARFKAGHPLNAYFELADGDLTAREILQHRLRADLLVLSACESGRVDSLGGEELAGLSQSFLQAGVRSLLVSLWEVDDPATAAFMRAFYTKWQEEGADKARALRQAMSQIQQDPRWSDTYYWGAFVLVGDWD